MISERKPRYNWQFFKLYISDQAKRNLRLILLLKMPNHVHFNGQKLSHVLESCLLLHSFWVLCLIASNPDLCHLSYFKNGKIDFI